LHVKLQVPDPQVEALALVLLQATLLPHVVPQLAVEFRFVSQPSLVPPQSAKPDAQLVVPHTPFVHEAVPFAVEHALTFAQAVPHVEVEFRLVSQPSFVPPQSA
jgi:hypothetical protein